MQSDRDVIDRIQAMSGLTPTVYINGLSLDQLMEFDPFADSGNLAGMTLEEATRILDCISEAKGYGEIADSMVRLEAFVFGQVFGHSVSAWLLSEAARPSAIDRSYEMTDPPTGECAIDRDLGLSLSKLGQNLLGNLRRLQAGYVGRLNRVY